MINERTEFALRSLELGVNFSQLCEEYGISRRIGYKWKKRFLEEGTSGMQDLSRRPRNIPGGTTEHVLCRINQLRDAHESWGPKKIHQIYLKRFGSGPSLSTFKRIYEKSGWVKKRRRRKNGESGRIHTGVKAENPNDVWTVDFKGWWKTANGKKCEPLTLRDEATRYLLDVRSMATTKTIAVRSVFERVFLECGLPEAIRSDNGAPFAARSAVFGLSRLSAWWLVLGIDLERGRPGKPQDNGGHERMHRDIQAELTSHTSEDLEEQQAAFDLWRKRFNEERPHESLGMATPSEFYRPSERKFTGTPEDIEYESMLARRVNKRGYISLERINIPISTSLSGWSVGLKAIDADTYDVYFAKLRIGQIDLTTASFLVVASDHEERPSKQK